ncbi:MAG: isoprenylcysteine carboxylmethyltransferase family protein [Opitutaceae bacterium]
MHLPLPANLGLLYLSSELALRFLKRSDPRAKRRDAGSLTVLWVTILASIGAAVAVVYFLPRFNFVLTPAVAQIFGLLFAVGLVLRWWSILSLGRFFTVDVAIAQDHELIVRGPYHWMRHPSYTGMMLVFIALATTFQNWLSIACILIPISCALAYRIYIEEIALEVTFGDAYQEYARTTKRLIPGVF